jgi:hypothetical protein
MLNNKKTIKINPEIFKFGGKNKREKTVKNNFTIPLVSPNILKNKLLKRVQDKKNKELSAIKNTPVENQNMNEKYNNEFNESIQYLQVLSNEKKKKEENIKREQLKNNLMKQTIRNKEPNLTNNLHINLELPDELKEDYYTRHIQKQPNALTSQPSLRLSYNVDNNIPYGCLKGGIKKTYRLYKKDMPPHTHANQPHHLQSQKIPSLNKTEHLSERELKLHKLKEKVFNQHKFINNKINDSSAGQIKTNNSHEFTINPTRANDTTMPHTPDTPDTPENSINTKINNNTSLNTNYIESYNNDNLSKEIPTIKKKITTIRKYKLGKSKHNRTIGILLKDAQTKSKIMEDYKEIKNTNINDIKKYLHKNNLLKYGSSAPNDVTRKIYENSVLAGEIINVNTDTIIHNMSNNKSDE